MMINLIYYSFVLSYYWRCIIQFLGRKRIEGCLGALYMKDAYEDSYISQNSYFNGAVKSLSSGNHITPNRVGINRFADPYFGMRSKPMKDDFTSSLFHPSVKEHFQPNTNVKLDVEGIVQVAHGGNSPVSWVSSVSSNAKSLSLDSGIPNSAIGEGCSHVKFIIFKPSPHPTFSQKMADSYIQYILKFNTQPKRYGSIAEAQHDIFSTADLIYNKLHGMERLSVEIEKPLDKIKCQDWSVSGKENPLYTVYEDYVKFHAQNNPKWTVADRPTLVEFYYKKLDMGPSASVRQALENGFQCTPRYAERVMELSENCHFGGLNPSVVGSTSPEDLYGCSKLLGCLSRKYIEWNTFWTKAAEAECVRARSRVLSSLSETDVPRGLIPESQIPNRFAFEELSGKWFDAFTHAGVGDQIAALDKVLSNDAYWSLLVNIVS